MPGSPCSCPWLALAGVLILDGLRGPQVGAMNLAGVLPWIHWRGLLILSLLAAGNFFCMACPFLLPRTLARRWLPAGPSLAALAAEQVAGGGPARAVPVGLRGIQLVGQPVVDGMARAGVLRPGLCHRRLLPRRRLLQVRLPHRPVQLRAVAGFAAGSEGPRSGVCAACRTKDCIRGRDEIPGCELHLFQPRKAGNMDCTFCLDCVHACPHDNVGMLARPPGSDLWHDGPRSGVGPLGKRPDLAVLVVILVFGAFANAAGMVGPVLAWRDRLGSFLGQPSPLLVTSLFYFFGLLVLPLAGSRRRGRSEPSLGPAHRQLVRGGDAIFVCPGPLGFSMWLAHYSFHLLTSYDTVVPTTQRFLADLGWSALGPPHWVAACCRRRGGLAAAAGGPLPGLGTAAVAVHRLPHCLGPVAPTVASLVGAGAVGTADTLLCAAGIWLVFQPMQMRGTLQM